MDVIQLHLMANHFPISLAVTGALAASAAVVIALAADDHGSGGGERG